MNLGSRLEGLNKAYGTEILIGENTAQLVQESFLPREMMLLANQIAGANRAKGDLYVLERGTSHNQSTSRCRLMAVAVAMC